MSEFINNSKQQIEELYEFSLGIVNGEKSRDFIDKYSEAVDYLTMSQIIIIVDMLAKAGIETEKIKTGLNKLFNVFHRSIINFKIDIPEQGSFLHYLRQENQELIIKLKNIKKIIKKLNPDFLPEKEFTAVVNDLKNKITELNEINLHYLKKENILFPYLEKEWEHHGCLSIMWSYHDDVRDNIKNILSLLENKDFNLKKLQQQLGKLFFNIHAVYSREENILFPAALNTISEELWNVMLEESMEIGFSFISVPSDILKKSKKRKKSKKKSAKPHSSKEDSFSKEDNFNIPNSDNVTLDFETGQMTLRQAILLLNSLPVNITFVDENDEVKYFSRPEERFFTRSKAIIGRKVANCHPPESVHIVNELVDSFKSGDKNKESFWIQMQGKFILIQYFALRDEDGSYKGTIEVSQDITDIRKLDGEKRLMSDA